jgi:hypothetical protein
MDDTTAPTCSEEGCETVRTDEPDYSPVQAITGAPLGWYANDEEGEICPKHIARLMASGNRMPYRYALPGGDIGTVYP